MDEEYALKLVTDNERLNSLKLRELEALERVRDMLRSGTDPMPWLEQQIAEFRSED